MSSLIQVGLHVNLILYLLSTVFYFAGTFTGKKLLLPLASWAAAMGCLCNLATIIIRIVISGRLPLSSGPEFILDFAFLTVFLYLILERKSENMMPGWALMLISTVLILFVNITAEGQLGEAGHLMPALKSPWLAVHVLTAIIAYAGFALAAAVAVVDIAQKLEKEQDDRIYRIVRTSFVMLSLSIVLGAIWAEQAWGSYWSWDPKEDWALITWIIYAVYLHLHKKMDWKGKRAAWLVIVGFIVVLFTFFGVNYLMSGMHSYA